jgi:hypothetical protein
MKKAIVFLLLGSSFFAEAQSLKEALFSGRLKGTPGVMIRKGDDFSALMADSAVKAPAPTNSVATATTVVPDSATQTATTQTTSVQTDTVAVATVNNTVNNNTTEATSADTTTAVAAANPPAEAPVAAKDNNVLWKEYVDGVASTLKTEVLSSKKVKKGTYYVLVSYTIGTEGEVAVTNVFVSPENSYLQDQIKERLSLNAPGLAPVLNSVGTPRKVNKKYNFTLVKD